MENEIQQMTETCAVCHKGKGPEKCEVCGFSDNGVIYRTFPIPEDAQNWVETVVKPYRAQWEITKSNKFTDPRDGKVYKTVKIGNQIWMAENLNYEIPDGGMYCYDNEIYGKIYDWYRAIEACPSGWHLPVMDEWYELMEAVGGEKKAGKHLKAKFGWKDYRDKSGNGLDTYGFAALPGSCYITSPYSKCLNDYNGYWWCASKDAGSAYYWSLKYDSDRFYYNSKGEGNYLHSVRCVQD